MVMILHFVCVLVVLAVALAGPSADKIQSLPGWSGELPSAQYSGFLRVESGSNLHYWFVEAEVEDPTSVATVAWFNGGPGCSSLDGFIYEMGPFEVQKDLTLVPREYRWNKLVNMLYIEAPVGVGFSYNDNGNYKCDDDRTANENADAVAKFYSLFPEHNKPNSEFYIFGESYAGVYVPTLAESILERTFDGKWSGAALKGIAVGNGCSGTEVGICGSGPQGTYYEWSYLMQSSLVSNALKNKVNSECDWAAAAVNEEGALSSKCIKLLNQASEQINNVNMYGVFVDCVNDSGCESDDNYKAAVDMDGSIRGKVPDRKPLVVGDTTLGARIAVHGPEACIDSKMASAYLNQESVQKAIHVDISNNGQSCWSVCGSAPGWSYNSTRTNLPENTYPFLTKHIRVTIYNGDWDACVPYTDGEGWTSGMNLPIKNDWHSWSYTSTQGNANQVGGYATEYEIDGDGSFEFITVKGGRHEVPETAPAQAFEMLTRVVNKEEF
jgi:serine carboxypeptidase-like clade I